MNAAAISTKKPMLVHMRRLWAGCTPRNCQRINQHQGDHARSPANLSGAKFHTRSKSCTFFLRYVASATAAEEAVRVSPSRLVSWGRLTAAYVA